MASVNTLIRKGYLLAGVVMAANMFIVNEMKAMKNNRDNSDKKNQDMDNGYNDGGYTIENEKGEKGFLENEKVMEKIHFFLFLEDYSNFFGTFALASVNNYFKLWNYDVGRYWDLGCFGWRSGRFLNDICQFDVNINLGRGIFWLIPGFLYFLRGNPTDFKKEAPIPSKIVYYFFLYKTDMKENLNTNYNNKVRCYRLALSILQGFISLPITMHISKFIISISLDAIIWKLIGIYIDKKVTKPKSNNDDMDERIEYQQIDHNNIN